MKQLLALIIGLAVGIGIALLVGWVLFPVGPYDTQPATLRSDYHAEYVRLVAIAYQVDADLGVAQARLEKLAPADPLAALVNQTERWITQDKPERLIIPLIRLARDLGVETPTMTSYLTTGGPSTEGGPSVEGTAEGGTP